jgi:hypothetical protein
MNPPISTNGATAHIRARRLNIYRKLSLIQARLDKMNVAVGRRKLKWQRAGDSDLELHIAELSASVSQKMQLITTLIGED